MDGDDASEKSFPTSPQLNSCANNVDNNNKQLAQQNESINPGSSTINNTTNSSHNNNNNEGNNNNNKGNNEDINSNDDNNDIDNQGSIAEELIVADYVAKCLSKYNLCVVDDFLDDAKGLGILAEVKEIEATNVMEDGQLVDGGVDGPKESGKRDEGGRIRGDKVHWVDPDKTNYIAHLIQKIDKVVYALNGRFPDKVIMSRCKPMLACYPGHGASYARHVDNSKRDGRLLTCLYYLNEGWNAATDGGLLRIYSQNSPKPIDIEPIFNRLLVFWSDKRNPHEVLPAFKHRYAITLWYFDHNERNIVRNRLLAQESSHADPAVIKS